MEWTQEINELLLELRDLGRSQKDIAAKVNADYGTKTTRDAVKNQLFRLDAKENLEQSIENKKLKGFVDKVGKYEITKELIQDSVKGIKLSGIKPPKLTTNKTKPKETAVLCLSDCQAGRITKENGVVIFNSHILLGKIEELTEKVIHITSILRNGYNLDELVILFLGDIVDGQGIFANQAYMLDHNVVDQVFQVALPALIKAITQFAVVYPKITIHAVSGNHGRTGKELPVESNWDMVLYYALQRALEPLRSVQMSEPSSTTQLIEIRGKKALLTHGDLIRSQSGQPAQSLINRGLRWQQSIGQFDYLICGHFHHTVMNDFNNFELLINGTFMDGDDYALNNMGLVSSTKQLFFGVNEKHGITWRYKLDV